jgi:hypothetical protein
MHEGMQQLFMEKKKTWKGEGEDARMTGVGQIHQGVVATLDKCTLDIDVMIVEDPSNDRGMRNLAGTPSEIISIYLSLLQCYISRNGL